VNAVDRRRALLAWLRDPARGSVRARDARYELSIYEWNDYHAVAADFKVLEKEGFARRVGDRWEAVWASKEKRDGS
jgi:hypothetical protein